MDTAQQIEKTKQLIAVSQLPEEALAKAEQELSRTEIILKTAGYSLEVDRSLDYIRFICALPWSKSAQEILDLARAKAILDKNHFGLNQVKERILEFLAVLILNQRQSLKGHFSSLAFVGLVGSGKTSLAYSIAESLGRPIIRIPFGGLGSAMQLRGESRVKPEAEPGLIIKAFAKAGVKNPVILLDELDRVAEETRTDIMGVLVELLDPEQNNGFLDHYLDIPFDLSQVLFISTANNTNNISTAVMDRLELIEMPFYTDQEKLQIAQQYLLPEALKEAGLPANTLQIDPTLWPDIIRPLGFDGGIRSLKRTVENIVRKIARQVVEGQPGPFLLNSQNINLYLNK